MKIAILLPYKENFSFKYPCSVSIFLKDTLKLSKYQNFYLEFYLQKYLNKNNSCS